MSRDILDCHNWRRGVASSGWRPRMLLNILQCTEQSPLSPQMLLLWNWDLCIQSCVYICVRVYVHIHIFFPFYTEDCCVILAWLAVDWMTEYFGKPHLWSQNPLFSVGKKYQSTCLARLYVFYPQSVFSDGVLLLDFSLGRPGGSPAFFPLFLCSR